MGNQLKTSRQSQNTRSVPEAPPTQPTSNDSRTSFISPKCGHWVGTYTQYGTQYPFFMDLLFFDDQRVSGSGYDELGGFDVRGDFNRLTGQISFDKVYRGMHTVQYTGTITDDGRIIKGVYWNSGPFEMSVSVVKPITPIVFRVTDSEVDSGILHLKYSSSTDEYIRVHNDNEHIPGWSNGIYHEENMYRKVEYDWKKTYLSRSPDTSSNDAGSISWKFDFGDHEIDYLKLNLNSTTFKNGQVSWCIVAEDSRETSLDAFMNPEGRSEGPPGNNAHFSGQSSVTVEAIRGASGFTLTASLSKGKDNDNVAWQHAQLFRQSTKEKDVYPFEVQVFMRKPQDWQMLKSVLEANKYMYDHRQMASDVQFLIGPEHVSVPAHKYVLITRSPVFCSMFYGGLAQEDSNQVSIPDVEVDAFQEFLRFLYYDDVNINLDNAFEVFFYSKKYLVPALGKKCIRFIVTNLAKDNCCSVLTQAVLCDEIQLIAPTVAFLYDNLSDIFEGQFYKSLSLDALVHILRTREFDVESEEFLGMLEVWAGEECSRRQRGGAECSQQIVMDELCKQVPDLMILFKKI